MASSSAQSKLSSKSLGDGVAGDVIQRFALEHVPDSDANWHDARTTSALFADDPDELLFSGLCVVEAGTPVEIKATLVVRSAGEGNDRKGQWYIKRKAHDRLLEAGGVYLLVVYVQRRGREHLARIVVPAATMDDVLQESWYDVDADRSESTVAQLTWNRLIDEKYVGKRMTAVRHLWENVFRSGHSQNLTSRQDGRTANRCRSSRNGAVDSAPSAWSLPATSRQSISVSHKPEPSLRSCVGSFIESQLAESL